MAHTMLCKQCKARFTYRKNGRTRYFCTAKCYGKYRSAHYTKGNGGNWKGGRFYSNGYRYIRIVTHPQASKKGYVMEHRYIMEKHIGRLLDPVKEVVHHINGDKLDNRIDNLELVTRGRHLIMHLFPDNLS